MLYSHITQTHSEAVFTYDTNTVDRLTETLDTEDLTTVPTLMLYSHITQTHSQAVFTHDTNTVDRLTLCKHTLKLYSHASQTGSHALLNNPYKLHYVYNKKICKCVNGWPSSQDNTQTTTHKKTETRHRESEI